MNNSGGVLSQSQAGSGRYDSPASWQQRMLAVALSILFVAFVGTVVVTLTGRAFSGEPAASVIGFSVTSDSAVAVRFEVRKQPGGRAFCIVRARGRDGREVGRDVAEVDADGSPTSQVRTSFTLRTTARAVTGEVEGCTSEPLSKVVDPDHH